MYIYVICIYILYLIYIFYIYKFIKYCKKNFRNLPLRFFFKIKIQKSA